jgi:hypothetical protein
MKTAVFRYANGEVEKKLFEGVPVVRRFAYKKGEHGSIVGRVYFQIEPDQDLKSNVINYREISAPERQ